MILGVTLLQREALEAKAVGGASTVKVEAVVCTTLTARSEPYNRKAIHASGVKQGANAQRKCDYGKRCGREKLRLAAATSGRDRIATGKANVFGFYSGAPPFVPKRKTRSLWLLAWVVAVPAVSRFETRMRYAGRTVRFW